MFCTSQCGYILQDIKQILNLRKLGQENIFNVPFPFEDVTSSTRLSLAAQENGEVGWASPLGFGLCIVRQEKHALYGLDQIHNSMKAGKGNLKKKKRFKKIVF